MTGYRRITRFDSGGVGTPYWMRSETDVAEYSLFLRNSVCAAFAVGNIGDADPFDDRFIKPHLNFTV